MIFLQKIRTKDQGFMYTSHKQELIKPILTDFFFNLKIFTRIFKPKSHQFWPKLIFIKFFFKPGPSVPVHMGRPLGPPCAYEHPP